MKTTAPEHTLTTKLGRLAIEAGHTGLMLGRDRAGTPVPLHLFRPEPTTVAFVGGWWAARILVLRCLALGAMTAVRADGGLAETQQWIALDDAAGGTGQRVWPMRGDHLVWLPAVATSPVLHLYDVGPDGPPSRPVLGAWQTRLTVLARLAPASVPTLVDADVVLAQRLDPAEAELVATTLGRGEPTASLLQALDDDMVAACAAGTDRYAWLAPTAIERRLFGDPAR